MIKLNRALFTLLLAASATAQQPANDGTLTQVSRSAERELATSIQELNQVRQQIADEKLPLARELTELEDVLTRLRREHDQATRLADAGNLEISTLKAETKARADELSYLGNLLDEYARTFESRVIVGELQHCGEALESAKQATENTALSPSERFARQLALVDATVQRLFDALGGMRFPGVGVDLQGRVANGVFAIFGPIALFRGDSGGATGIVVPQVGSPHPLIRPLEGALQVGIAALVDGGEGLLPLDPSQGGALKALVQKTNLVHIFEKGGPIMWPLLLASILAFGTALERVMFLLGEKWKRDEKSLDQFFNAVTRGDIQGAIEVSKSSRFYILRALGYAVTHKEHALANALMIAQAREMKRFRRGIAVLDTVITLAPLLGLLGTVTGMMSSFSLIGGDLSAPGAITGGIAEALIATAFGLGIAITALLPFNYLNNRIDEARDELESATAQLELLLRPSASEATPSNQDANRAVESIERSQGDGHRRERPVILVGPNSTARIDSDRGV